MSNQSKPGGLFAVGNKGRPSGTRNKLQGDFLRELAADFADHGAGVIKIVRAEKPTEYLKIVASILPKELLINDTGVEDLTDADLQDALEIVRRSKTPKAPTSETPETSH